VRRRSLVSQMYRAARVAHDVSPLASGNLHRIARRARNKIVGRALGPTRRGQRTLYVSTEALLRIRYPETRSNLAAARLAEV